MLDRTYNRVRNVPFWALGPRTQANLVHDIFKMCSLGGDGGDDEVGDRTHFCWHIVVAMVTSGATLSECITSIHNG
jgi:hypothetical protein